MVTIKDIAAKCGVSVSTVSKALNGYSDVGKDTVERIRSLAHEMGYQPNGQARALKTNRTYNLGLLYYIKLGQGTGMSQAYFSEILNAFRAKAESYGYDITFISKNIGASNRSFLEHCHYRCVDGIAIICAQFEDDEVQELLRSDIPCVTIDYVHPRASAILSNNQQGMRLLVARAYQLGHRRIAFIHGTPHTPVTNERIRGYREGLQSVGLGFNQDYLVQADFNDMDLCAQKTAQLMRLSQPPTCILCPDDYSAMGALRQLRRTGYSVPDSVSICGFDGITLSQIVSPTLSTIRQDTQTMGALCAERLIKRIEMGSQQKSLPLSDRMHIPVQFLEGETLGKCRL